MISSPPRTRAARDLPSAPGSLLRGETSRSSSFATVSSVSRICLDWPGSTPGICTTMPSLPWRAMSGSAVPMELRRPSMTRMASSTWVCETGIFWPWSFSFAWILRENAEPPTMSMPPLSRSFKGNTAKQQRVMVPMSRTLPTLRFRRSISVAKYQKNRISRERPVRNRTSGSLKKMTANMGIGG